MSFKHAWKELQETENEYLVKSQGALTKQEIQGVQSFISKLREKKTKDDTIITKLQHYNKKLSERYKAERAYWTEVKRMQTEVVQEVGEELELEKYRVLLSPNACEHCRKMTENGKKTFTQNDLTKDGYGHVPPFHPNCYCVAIPK